MKYDLSESFPLMTTRKLHFKSIVNELIWLLSGSTNAKELKDKYGVKVWGSEASRESLDEKGFDEREVGDLGPMHGF